MIFSYFSSFRYPERIFFPIIPDKHNIAMIINIRTAITATINNIKLHSSKYPSMQTRF